jgi:hypothetical protein
LIEQAAADLFGEVTGEIREAGRIDAARKLSPEAVHHVRQKNHPGGYL